MVGEGGNKRRGGRKGEREQGEGGSDDATGSERQWRNGGLREGRLMKLTSEEGAGRCMEGGGRNRAVEGLSEEESEQGRETPRDVS